MIFKNMQWKEELKLAHCVLAYLLLLMMVSGCMETSEATECFSDDDCGDFETCVNGVCVKDMVSGTDPADNVGKTDEVITGDTSVTATPCPIGSEGCPCGAHKSCDPDLACYSNICVEDGSPVDTETGGSVAECPKGTETCPCRGDGTCEGDLSCLSGLCVDDGSVDTEMDGSVAECPEGAETCLCRDDRTCDGSLVCLSGLCVDLNDLDAGPGSDASIEQLWVLHVNGAVTTSGDGSSWDKAFRTIQEGIDAAHANWITGGSERSVEVWVAAGTYNPREHGEGDSIQLRSGVELLGGFAGTETEKDERSWEQNLSILTTGESSDQGGIFVRGSDDAVLDGFVLRGWGDLPNSMDTGVIHNDAVSPTIRNTVFLIEAGTPIWNRDNTVVVENCHFALRLASSFEASISLIDANATIRRTVFSTNEIHTVYAENGNLTFEDSFVIGGRGALGSDGLFLTLGTVASISNSLMIGSWGAWDAVYATDASSIALINATVAYFINPGVYVSEDSTAIITNSILWGSEITDGNECLGEPNICSVGDADVTVTYSDVQGGWPGEGNIDADPAFYGFGNPKFTGKWTKAPRYNPDLAKTIFKDEDASWTEDLTGMLLTPDYSAAGALYPASEETRDVHYIAGNTETEIYIWGDIASTSKSNKDYRIYDYRLGSDSPCIDAARGEGAPQTDIFGASRYDDTEVSDAFNCDPTSATCVDHVDMGPTEYRP